jgi:AraC family transcriptional regulator
MGVSVDQPAFIGSACVVRDAGACTLGHWVTRGANYKSISHGHEEAHFMYVPRGFEYVTEGRGERARSGANLIFNPPHTFHRDRLPGPGAFFSMSLSKALTDSLTELKLPTSPMQIGGPRAHILVGRLMRECSRWTQDSAPYVEALCLELIAAMLRPVHDTRPAHCFNQAVEILQTCGDADMSVMELARRVGVHPVYLARIFRAQGGCTPNEYLHALRVQRAAALLSANRRSVAEIAMATGFADQSHFTKQFRRAFGIPPGKYRRLTS